MSAPRVWIHTRKGNFAGRLLSVEGGIATFELTADFDAKMASRFADGFSEAGAVVQYKSEMIYPVPESELS